MTSDEALILFDRLDPVETSALRGSWRGEEFPSGHPLDGVLAAYGWRGKRFDSDEQVHPLLFGTGPQAFAVHPSWLVAGVPLILRFPRLKSEGVAHKLRPLLHLATTHHSQARLRMQQFRGKLGAAMVYDAVPAIDVFRRMDADTLLGLMDLKGMVQPLFFLLRRKRR